ncbi:MAG TPA: Hsp20/alpha crystallin family protein [Chthoniobacterales bacterium]|jgi:HSP20 family protein
MSLTRYQTPELSTWPSIDRLSTLRDEINNLFETPFFWSMPMRQSQLFNGWTPAIDLYQTNDDVIALVELPGMKKEDIELSLHDGMLTISGERKSETQDGDKTQRSERFIGKFRRSISLPTRVDGNKVSATYKDGILTVTLPKAEEVKPKQIQVNVS